MSTAAKVTILRAAALSLFEWCGWKSASNWSNEKLADKMKDVPEIAEGKDAPTDEGVAKTLIQVKAGVEDKSDFEVTDGAAAEAAGDAAAVETSAGAAEESKEKAKTPDPEKEKEKADKKAAKEEEKAKKKAEKEKEKADKKAAKEKEKADKKKGVRDGATRGYFAGKVLAKHGLEKGITEEMIAEVDTMYGKANHDVSRGALAWAYSGLKGYFDAKAETEATTTSA